MWGVSYGMIDKRSKKLLRRMVATPMKKSHFLVALMAVRIFMNIIEVFLLFIVACLVFDITIQGSAAALVCVFFAGNIAFCGIAVFTSSRTANTEVGNGLVNAVVMPMTVLSGIFFSYHNFPDWSIAFIRKLPLTMFIDAVRSIFNEGAGFAETGLAVISLTAVGIIFFSLGLRIFRWH
jgi:ABC-type multidrug transport system permease subunit